MSSQEHIFAPLRERISGALETTAVVRELYATDASMYYQRPSAVLAPKNQADIETALRFCAEHGISMTARGAGTGTAGQSIGKGLSIDFSRFMNQVLHINKEEQWAEVQPGLVYETFNHTLKDHGLFFPVNPSSGRMCALGGMTATNASGPYSFKYGAMKDNVLSIKILLHDGTVLDTHDDTSEKAKQLLAKISPFEDEIKKHQPKTRVSSSGYNVWDFIKNPQKNLTSVFVGSEGTLGILLSARLKLYPLPEQRSMAIIGFQTLQNCSEAVNRLRQLKPAAIEILDDILLEAIREAREDMRTAFPQGLSSVIFLEFDSNGAMNVQEKMQEAKVLLHEFAQDFMEVTDAKAFWEIRKSASPYLHKLGDQKKPLKFIEDGAVPPERLTDYLMGLKELLQQHETKGAVFGHAGNGHLHVNPRLDPRDPKDLQKLRAIYQGQTELVLRLSGTLTGEHGNGILRAHVLKEQYPTLLPAFQAIKEFFDPKQILNPGKIISTSDEKMNDWRYHLKQDQYISTDQTNWADFLRTLDACHGCGLCRHYCPVFEKQQQEIATGRAKAHLLRGVLAGHILPEDNALKPTLDLCKNCNLCAKFCPSQIDIAALCEEGQIRICPS